MTTLLANSIIIIFSLVSLVLIIRGLRTTIASFETQVRSCYLIIGSALMVAIASRFEFNQRPQIFSALSVIVWLILTGMYFTQLRQLKRGHREIMSRLNLNPPASTSN